MMSDVKGVPEEASKGGASPLRGRNAMLGVAQILLCSFLIGIAPAMSKVSYEAGAGVLTVGAFRGLAIALLYLPSAIHARAMLDRRKLAILLPLAAIYATFIWAYQKAIDVGGASQAMLVLFAHPIIVMAIQAVRGRESMKAAQIAMAAVSALGICLASEPWKETFSAAGFVLAAISSVLCAGIIVLYDDASRIGIKPGFCTFVVGIAILSGLGPMAWIAEGPAWPSGVVGWTSLVIPSVGVSVGLMFFVSAIARIGMIRTMMIGNLEPVFGLAAAALAAGERLDGLMLAGAALVVFAAVDWRYAWTAMGRPGKCRQTEGAMA